MIEDVGRVPPNNLEDETQDWRDALIGFLVPFLKRSQSELEKQLGGFFVYPDRAFHKSGHAKLCFLESNDPTNPNVLVKFFEDGYPYEKFLEEAKLYEKYKDIPGIIKPLKIIYNREEPIIIFTYYPAGDMLKQYSQRGNPNVGEITNIVDTLGSALTALHRDGIAHRDIKSKNVFVTTPDTFDGVVLADFDYSSVMIQHDRSIANSGTAQFMPPEAFQPFGYDHFLADQYALAIVFYQLFADWRLPYGDPHEAVATVVRNKNSTGMDIFRAAFAFASAQKSYQPLSARPDLQQRMPLVQLEAIDAVLQKGMSLDADDRFHDQSNPEDTRLAIEVFIKALLDALKTPVS